ncbi:16S rRNA (guanine(966)-N(2))-methyltransferase RsmD [Orrella sp. JC864]|uniref:16S rRNA (guanine(966)-N(2))-methyltransferase RsmD n=1 Tax=Orrella sp. JC864 TaxID=3120298 RepID=UPI0012BBF111
MTTKYIRIVGGSYRRTPIAVIDAPGLRPTPDRVRETLYNWLGHFWQGEFADKRVLDLFAGTGALGLEAASRGAREVLLVETDRRAVAALRALRQKLGAQAVRVHPGDALAALRGAAGYDLVLLDPPFRQGWLERLWPLLPGALAPAGLVYAESEAPLAAPPGFTLLRQDKAGAVHYHLFQFAASQN